MPVKDKEELDRYIEANKDSYGLEFIKVGIKAMEIIDSKGNTEMLYAKQILADAAKELNVGMSDYHEQAIARLISDVHSRGLEFKTSLDLQLRESLHGAKNYSLWFSFLLVASLLLSSCVRGPKIEVLGTNSTIAIHTQMAEYNQANLIIDEVIYEMIAVGLYNPLWPFEQKVKTRFMIYDTILEMVRQKKTDAEIHKALIDDLLEKQMH